MLLDQTKKHLNWLRLMGKKHCSQTAGLTEPQYQKSVLL